MRQFHCMKLEASRGALGAIVASIGRRKGILFFWLGSFLHVFSSFADSRKEISANSNNNDGWMVGQMNAKPVCQSRCFRNRFRSEMVMTATSKFVKFSISITR